jgi:branched-chain amino acid aminotransferase
MARYHGTANHIYMNGEFVPEAEAKVDVLSCAVKYGATVFEGLCGYLDDDGELNVFRLPEHTMRLMQSMLLMRFRHDYTAQSLGLVVLETLRANEVREDVHVRLSSFVEGRGFSTTVEPIGLACSISFRPDRSLEDKAARAAVSSWRRIDDATMPPRIKCAANYNNGRLGLLQAQEDGYDEVIFLTREGKVAESSSSCVFLIRDGVAMTSCRTHGILESITRDTVIELCRGQLGIEVVEREIDRTELYLADEAFLCGSSYEVTPIVAVDGIALGGGRVGPATRRIWESYEGALRGRIAGHIDWLTPVYGGR